MNTQNTQRPGILHETENRKETKSVHVTSTPASLFLVRPKHSTKCGKYHTSERLRIEPSTWAQTNNIWTIIPIRFYQTVASDATTKLHQCTVCVLILLAFNLWQTTNHRTPNFKTASETMNIQTIPSSLDLQKIHQAAS